MPTHYQSSVQVMPVVVGSRQYSPKLEMYRQLSQNLEYDTQVSRATAHFHGVLPQHQIIF
jgi:hypothetical protein